MHPAIVTVDFSTALITSLLSVYNGVKFDEYLQWCWEVVSGEATVRHFIHFKTIIHVCLAQFMHRVKLNFGKLFKGGLDIILYSVSLMANATTVPHVGEILYDFCVVFCSASQSQNFTTSYINIQHKISTICAKQVPTSIESVCHCVICTQEEESLTSSAVTQSCALDSVTELSSVGCNIDMVRDIGSVTIRGDESASLEHSQTSPFSVWSKEIMKAASNAVNSCSSKTYECRNKYYFPAVIEKLLMLHCLCGPCLC